MIIWQVVVLLKFEVSFLEQSLIYKFHPVSEKVLDFIDLWRQRLFWACLQNNDNFFPYSQLILILKLSFLNIPWYMKKDIWCCFRFDGVFLLLSHHRKQKCSIKLQNSSLFFSLNNGSQRWYERVEPDRD